MDGNPYQSPESRFERAGLRGSRTWILLVLIVAGLFVAPLLPAFQTAHENDEKKYREWKLRNLPKEESASIHPDE